MRSIDRIFMFSLSFTVGANYDVEDKERFNRKLFELISIFNENPGQYECDAPVIQPPDNAPYFNF